MNRFYLWMANTESGPFTIGQLRSMWSSGAVNFETLFRSGSDANWLPLSMIADSLESAQETTVLRAEPPAYYGHVKATTELTSKSIKAWMLVFGLCFWGFLFAIPIDFDHWGLWLTGSCLSILGYQFCKIARWWENE